MPTTRPYGRDEWSDDKALFQAAETGDMEAVERLLAVGANPERKINGTGECSLHACADAGHTEVLLRLIEAGGDVNVRTGNDWTPLHYACRRGGLETVAALVSEGADLDAVADPSARFRGKTSDALVDHTPLHFAMRFDPVDRKGALMPAAVMRAAREDGLAIIGLLADAGANLDARRGERQNSLLEDAISLMDRNDIVDLLLSSGASTESKGKNGRTALWTACSMGNADAAEMLLMAGADPLATNDKGSTAIHIALAGKNASGCLSAIARHSSVEACRSIIDAETGPADHRCGANESILEYSLRSLDFDDEREGMLMELATKHGSKEAVIDFLAKMTARVEEHDFLIDTEARAKQSQPARRRI